MPVAGGADDTPERVLTGLERDFGAYLDFEEKLPVADAQCLRGDALWRAPCYPPRLIVCASLTRRARCDDGRPRRVVVACRERRDGPDARRRR